MGFFEQLLSRATLLHVSQEILYGDTLPISEMNFDDMINEVNSKYDSLKEALAKEHIDEIDSIVYSYTSDLIDIYHSMGIRAGAKLHSELIGYPNKSSGLSKLLSKNSPGQEVHIKSIIQEIFQGTLNPAEQFETIFKTYKEKTKDLDSLISPFYSDLSESQQIAFDNIMNAHIGVVRIELEQSFSDGFCIYRQLRAHCTPILSSCAAQKVHACRSVEHPVSRKTMCPFPERSAVTID